MTRKDYVKIARVLSCSASDPLTIKNFCIMLLEDNPRFDEVRFLAACKHQGADKPLDEVKGGEQHGN